MIYNYNAGLIESPTKKNLKTPSTLTFSKTSLVDQPSLYSLINTQFMTP
jgi:hypothetical protein